MAYTPFSQIGQPEQFGPEAPPETPQTWSSVANEYDQPYIPPTPTAPQLGTYQVQPAPVTGEVRIPGVNGMYRNGEWKTYEQISQEEQPQGFWATGLGGAISGGLDYLQRAQERAANDPFIGAFGPAGVGAMGAYEAASLLASPFTAQAGREIAKGLGYGETGQEIADVLGGLAPFSPEAFKAARGLYRIGERSAQQAALSEAFGPEFRNAYTEALGTAIPGEEVGSVGARFARRIAGGAPFTDEELRAQQIHLNRQVEQSPSLTNAIAKIQDAILEERRIRESGIAGKEITAGRAAQGGGAGSALDLAANGDLTLSELADLARQGMTTGPLRKTFAPGVELNTEEQRAIAKLLATSPALQGKPLTAGNLSMALDDFLRSGDTGLQPDQLRNLSDLLGINLEVTPVRRGPAVGAYPEGAQAQYPARITGERTAPVTQTFTGPQPQQEIAGRARIIGSDGMVKEGVIQPSLMEPDKFMLVNPETGMPIPDFKPDGTPILGSEIRSAQSTVIRPSELTQFPSTKGMERAPVQTGLGIPETPLEGYTGTVENVLTSEQAARAATARRAREAEAAMAGREGEATIAERSRATFQPQRPEFPEQSPLQLTLGETEALEGARAIPRIAGETDEQYLYRIRLMHEARAAEARMGVGGIGAGQEIGTMRPTFRGETTPGAGMHDVPLQEPMALPGTPAPNLPSQSLTDKIYETGAEILRFPMTARTTYDLSAPGRQLAPMLYAHPTAIPRVVNAQRKAFKSEEAYQELISALEKSPNKIYRDIAKVEIPGIGGLREELLQSKYAEKVLPGARKFDRAYEAAIGEGRNWLFDQLLAKVDKSLLTEAALKEGGAGRAELERIGKIVNASTGRGNLPKFMAENKVLGQPLLWAPRLLAGRIQVPLSALASSSPIVRKEAARQMIAFVGVNTAILGMIKASGVADVELDPRSSDFGQIRIGNRRWDPWAGYRPIVNLIARMGATAAGVVDPSIMNYKEINSDGRPGVLQGKDATRLIQNFIRNKLTPTSSEFVSQWTGRDPSGAAVDKFGIDFGTRPGSLASKSLSRAQHAAVNLGASLFLSSLAEEMGYTGKIAYERGGPKEVAGEFGKAILANIPAFGGMGYGYYEPPQIGGSGIGGIGKIGSGLGSIKSR